MENKAMYLSTYEERENGSFYEEGYDGRNLSKLNLCEDGKEAISLLSCINPCPLTFHTFAQGLIITLTHSHTQESDFPFPFSLYLQLQAYL
jgi:hypothetical protein